MNNKQKPFWHFAGGIFLIAILAFLIPAWGHSAKAAYNVGVGFSYGSSDIDFLGTYGTWTDFAPYGQVWVPSVAADWRPFAYGHWIWTDDGWTWSSYEPYGWLVYHYGHWDYQQGIGWFWIPGNEWSPAPVVWSTFGNYVCWAPEPVAGVYWPQPWESSPFGFNIWIGVRLNNFDRDDVGRFRVHEFPTRNVILREHAFPRPPNIVLAERYAHHPIVTRRIERERVPWPNRNYDRMIPPQSDQAVIQRWQREQQGRVYMPRSAPPQQRERGENGGSSKGDHRNSGNRDGESHGNGHGHGGGHGERGRGR